MSLKMNGAELLNEFRTTRSESAFAELVRRYAGLVYSVAKRQIPDGSLAEDATQIVFARLAKHPPTLKEEAALAAWLHRTAVHVSIDLWRSETRRRTREQEAVRMQTAPDDNSKVWEHMAPHIDVALDGLGEEERQVVLLRFFEGKAMREIGQLFSISEDAAKMRVSRAVARLRDGLASRGVLCTAIVLTALLTERATEAAPMHLMTKLALKPAVTGATVTSIVQRALQSKVIIMTSAVFIVSIAIVLVSAQHKTSAEAKENIAAPAVTPVQSPTAAPVAPRGNELPRALAREPEPASVGRFVFHVADKESGVGIAGARLRVAYFYAGGQGEGHEAQTDGHGDAIIPQPNHPEQHVGLNLFTVAPGYVPKCINYGGNAPITNCTLMLESALTIGGTVVDEQGQPVSGVHIDANRAGDDPYNEGGPTTDFQNCKVVTDAQGRWSFPFVPKSYSELRVHLTCSNYAVTSCSIPVAKAEGATLTIQRGSTVSGRVVDTFGQPIANARVRELHNFGWRRLSAKADEDGRFELRGLAVPEQVTIDYSDPASPKRTVAEGKQIVKLTIEAKGMAPQEQTVELLLPTNNVNFVLAAAPVFHGHVVDQEGNAIAGAVVRTDWDFKNQVPTRFDWSTKTDSNGWFEWDSAPAETTYFWFEADGYQILRSTPFKPDGTEYRVVLRKKAE